MEAARGWKAGKRRRRGEDAFGSGFKTLSPSETAPGYATASGRNETPR